MTKNKESKKEDSGKHSDEKAEEKPKQQKDFIPEINLEQEVKSEKLPKKQKKDFDEEESSEGLTLGELDFSDSKVSLEMINSPMRRLVPLEKVLEDAPPPTIENNTTNKDEFNPFQYNAKTGDLEQLKYSSHYSELPRVAKVEISSLGGQQKRTEVGFSPMYSPNNEMPEKIFNSVKKTETSELGKDPFKINTEIKYTPSEHDH